MPLPSKRCMKCKRDKKRCDGQSPCARCRLIDVPCIAGNLWLNYGAPAPLEASKEAIHTNRDLRLGDWEASTRSVSELDVQEIRYPSPTRGVLSLIFDRAALLQDAHGNLRNAAISLSMSAVSRPPYDSIETLRPLEFAFARHYPRSALDSPLRSATEAWALSTFAGKEVSPESNVLALKTYGRAMRRVQAQLNDLPSDSQALQELVLAVFALVLFEAEADNGERCQAHTDGLMKLMNTITKMIDIQKLKEMDSLAAVGNVIMFQKSFRPQPDLDHGFPYSEIPLHHLNPGDKFAQMFISSGFKRQGKACIRHIDDKELPVNASSIFENVLMLDQKLKDWYSALPPTWHQPTKIMRRTFSEEKLPWPPYAYVYSEPVAAILINRYRTWRMFLMNSMRTCLPFIDPSKHNIPATWTRDLMASSRETATELCATFFSLFDRTLIDPNDDTTDLPKPNVPFDQFFTSMSSLTTAYGFGCLETHEQQWINTCFRQFKTFFFYTIKGIEFTQHFDEDSQFLTKLKTQPEVSDWKT